MYAYGAFFLFEICFLSILYKLILHINIIWFKIKTSQHARELQSMFEYDKVQVLPSKNS
jgi:hypothetical protein